MKVFGMRTVTVNGNVIYIIKVRVKDNGANTIALTPLTSINGVTLSTVSGKHGNMIEINYFGLSNNVSSDVFREVGKALKQVQFTYVNAKCAWAEPYYYYGHLVEEGIF
jgi:hypothetical protein